MASRSMSVRIKHRVGVLVGRDDRLAAYVEGGVHQDGAAGERSELAQQPVQDGVVFPADGLYAGGEVDVCDGGNRRALDVQQFQPVCVLGDRRSVALPLGHRCHQQHVRARPAEQEVLLGILCEHDGANGRNDSRN